MRATDLTSAHRSRPVVYLDMDGVLADFFGEVAREHKVGYWREIHRKDLGVDQIAQQPGFFADLPVMAHAAQLMMGVLALTDHYSILSSPLMSEVEQSSSEKSEWLEKHLGRHQPQAVIFDHEKFKYARQADGTPNILIDDWDTNIGLWESMGGIGILHTDKNYRDTVKDLAHALAGVKLPHPPTLSIDKNHDQHHDINDGQLFTNQEVLRYVTGIHNEYHMPKPILKHKTWILRNVELADLKSPEYVHQDDPYRRVIDLDWDHISKITHQDLINKPIVADETGWILDGNHRVTAARAAGLKTIPAIIPYNK